MSKKTSKKKRILPSVKIIPFGGLEQIGLNITAFEYNNSIIIVDCGIAFPTENMPGIDLIIPDVTYLKANIKKVKGFFITHGHEDHIGAIPYVLREINVPIYGTQFTIALIEHKLEETGLLESSKLRIADYGDIIKAGEFEVEFVRTNHSITDAAALAIYSPAGTIFHTGDFKIDFTPVFGEHADLQRMAEIGSEGCLAVLCDSTNAALQGHTPSESTVGPVLDAIFAENTDKRIIVASFASNVDRIQQVITTAYKYGRKVIVEGRSMVQAVDIASDMGYMDIPEGTLIEIGRINNFRPQDVVIITTGSQGESMAALSRMASGAHKKLTITQNDLIILSAKTIPGNEKAVSKVVNELFAKGAEVVLRDAHVSGHAREEDIKLIYALLKPKFAMPVHGECMHLIANRKIAVSMGIPEENVLIMSSGDVVELNEDEFKVIEHFDAPPILVDGLGVGDVGTSVLKDRQSLGQNGIIVVSLAIDDNTGEVLNGPNIDTRGFIYTKENEDLIAEAVSVIEDRIYGLDYSDMDKFKAEIREALRSFLWKKIKRTPVIMPIIIRVEV